MINSHSCFSFVLLSQYLCFLLSLCCNYITAAYFFSSKIPSCIVLNFYSQCLTSTTCFTVPNTIIRGEFRCFSWASSKLKLPYPWSLAVILRSCNRHRVVAHTNTACILWLLYAYSVYLNIVWMCSDLLIPKKTAFKGMISNLYIVCKSSKVQRLYYTCQQI